MENLAKKSMTLTIYAWMGFVLILAGIVISIMGVVPNDSFMLEFGDFKMSTRQTGLVMIFFGALVGYLATKSTASQATTYSTKQMPGANFRSKMYTIFIIMGIIALLTFLILRFSNL